MNPPPPYEDLHALTGKKEKRQQQFICTETQPNYYSPLAPVWWVLVTDRHSSFFSFNAIAFHSIIPIPIL